MKVAVTGASGLIGRGVSAALRGAGHDVVRMVRRKASGPDEVAWDPDVGTVDTDGLTGVEAVVHLAAEPLEPRPLTAAKKERIRSTRVNGTRTVAMAVAAMDEPPRILLSSSGTNAYGDRGDEVLTEDSASGEGWLPSVVEQWEAALQPAREAGVRTVAMRTGVVLDRSATILKVLGNLARFGLAAPIGNGRQYWSWISLYDTAGLYLHTLAHDEIEGILNLSAPNPVTNAEFTRTLAHVLRRPVFPVKVPRFAPRLALRPDYADSLLFDSVRVYPERALATGYEFRHENLEAALRDIYP